MPLIRNVFALIVFGIGSEEFGFVGGGGVEFFAGGGEGGGVVVEKFEVFELFFFV